MGQSSQCNCQCGFEAAKKYTCYNGFCVEDVMGEYNEPTCGGNCPVPTQYACVSGYCIPTIGGTYNNPTCNGNCPVMPTQRYSCISSICTKTKGGSYYVPTCNGACSPRSVDYNCVNGFCQPQAGGPYKNNPTCNNVCPTPSGKLYKCVSGQCIEAVDGIYLDDPTCSGNCTPGSGNYLLVNCQNENETIIATAPSGTYKPPYNGVWKVDSKCWRMVGETQCPCSPPPIVLPDTKTAGCDSCNNGVCCFEVWPCAWRVGEFPVGGFSCNTNTGKCEPSEGGIYPPNDCGGCDNFYYKICVSGLNPTDCQSYVNKTISIFPCDQLGPNDYGPPCTPGPGFMASNGYCRCCFNVINSIPEDPEATHHNFVNVYNNCCECNPCSETKNCNPGEVFVGNCNRCDCVCVEPPCGGDPPASGACCDVSCDAISCIDGWTVEQCNEIGGTFYLGQNCGSAPCVPESCDDNPACCTGFECNGFGQCLPADNYVSHEDCMRTCYQPE